MRETLVILNVIINCVCVFSTVLEVPQNLAVVVGQRTSFRCRTSNGSIVREWLFEDGFSAGLKVFANWGFFWAPSADSGYGVDVDSNGSGELFINDTQLANAGKYSCVTDVSRTITRYYAELIVLETEPVCRETRHVDGRFEAECSANFSGSWAPKMEWQYDGLNVNIMDDSTSKSRVTSKVDAVITKDLFSIFCAIRFIRSGGTGDAGQTTATNVYIWNGYNVRTGADANGTNETTSFPSDAKGPTSGECFEKAEPVCTETRYEDGRFEAECSVNFSGSRAPKMEWQYSNKGITINKTSQTIIKTRVTSKVEAVITKDAFRISCKIRFSHSCGTSDNDQTTATNVPGYVYIWNAKTASYTSTPSNAKDLRAGGPFENMTMMYIVAGLAFALILLTVVTLLYICRKRKRKRKTKSISQDQSPVKGDEETKSRDQIYSGTYDTIEYDAIGYEMPEYVFSPDGLNRSDELHFEDRVQSGYEDPDKALNANDDELIPLSSQYITTTEDPDNGIADDILDTDCFSHDAENKYMPLSDFDFGKRNSEKKTSEESDRASYLEIVGDEDEMKATRESGISGKSSSSEGSQDKNKAPATNANYTQLMPESGYTPLVL